MSVARHSPYFYQAQHGTSVGEPARPDRIGPLPNTCTHEGWTDPRVKTLVEDWTAGLSAGQIAKKLGGVTRSAVIGKVHRLGLPGRDRPSKPQVRFEIHPQARAFGPTRVKPKYILIGHSGVVEKPDGKPPRTDFDPAKFAPLPGTIPVPFMSRASQQCPWPVGGVGADMLCCGAKRQDERPYCGTHTEASIQPPQPGKPKRSERELVRSLRWIVGA